MVGEAYGVVQKDALPALGRRELNTLSGQFHIGHHEVLLREHVKAEIQKKKMSLFYELERLDSAGIPTCPQRLAMENELKITSRQKIIDEVRMAPDQAHCYTSHLARF